MIKDLETAPPIHDSDFGGENDPEWINTYKFQRRLERAVINRAISGIALSGYIEKPDEVEGILVFRVQGHMDQAISEGVARISLLACEFDLPTILKVLLISREDAIRQVHDSEDIRSYDITQTALQQLEQI